MNGEVALAQVPAPENKIMADRGPETSFQVRVIKGTGKKFYLIKAGCQYRIATSQSEAEALTIELFSETYGFLFPAKGKRTAKIKKVINRTRNPKR